MPKKVREKFSDQIEGISQEEESFQIYTKLSKKEMEHNTIMKTAEIMIEQAKKDIEQAKKESEQARKDKEKFKKEGIQQNQKEAAINLHKNGASDELIINSLNITNEKLQEYLKCI